MQHSHQALGPLDACFEEHLFPGGIAGYISVSLSLKFGY
jgi:hypothetical protein